jgi:hypothetical protein
VIDDNVRGQLKAQYPSEKLTWITSPDGELTIVVKGADRGSWLKYRSMAMDISGDSVKRASAAQFLCQAMLVYPTREELEAKLEQLRMHGFYHSIIGKLTDISGDREGATVGEV